MKIYSINITTILKIINFLIISFPLFPSSSFELKEEVLGSNKKKHYYENKNKNFKIKKQDIVNQALDTVKEFQISNNEILDSQQEEYNLVDSNIDREDNLIKIGAQVITPFINKTRKFNFIRHMFRYSKELEIFNKSSIIKLYVRRFLNESSIKDNLTSLDNYNVFLENDLIKLSTKLNFITKDILDNNLLLDNRREKSFETKAAVDFMNYIIKFEFWLLEANYVKKSERDNYDIFCFKSSIDRNFDIKGNLKLKAGFVINKVDKNIEKFIFFKIVKNITDILGESNSLNINFGLDTDTSVFKNFNKESLGVKLLFNVKSNIFDLFKNNLDICFRISINDLKKIFNKRTDIDISKPIGIRREKNLLIKDRLDFSASNLSSTLKGSIHYTYDKLVFEEQPDLSLKIINLKDWNLWYELYLNIKINYSIIELMIKYKLNLNNFYFNPRNEVNFNLYLYPVNNIKLKLENDFKSDFKVNKLITMKRRFVNNIKFSYSFEAIELMFKVENLFNQLAYKKSNIPEEKRRIALDMKIKF